MSKGGNFAGSDEPDAPRFGRARRDHPVTSHLAAIEIKGISGIQRRQVYDCLILHGGMTDAEIQSTLGLDPSSERPRRVELVDSGHVMDSGKTRATASGRQAVVWVAKLVESQGERFPSA